MPHATHMPVLGFQALVFCGPGASLSTFTTKPEDFPKATIPIANRPMLWYALDYCYRMGINDIYIITPPASSKAIEDTLATNPHLTSLPNPKPTLIAPKSLTHESGTADILRAPEVLKVLDSDFVVLPCDIVSELPGESLLETWLTQQTDLEVASSPSKSIIAAPPSTSPTKPSLSTSTSASSITSNPPAPRPTTICPRKGGLGVWYPTRGPQAFKGEETDFLVSSRFPSPIVRAPDGSVSGDVRGRIETVRYAMPTDTLNDTLEEEKALAFRTALLARVGAVKMRTSYRDAHVYVFPRWVLEMVRRTPELVSVSEDVVGNWAKASWQDGFADKLGLQGVFGSEEHGASAGEPDVMSMVSTRPSKLEALLGEDDSKPATTTTTTTTTTKSSIRKNKLKTPDFLGYIHPLSETGPLLRRVDNMPTLLSVSLRLARLESVEDAALAGRTPSPLAHTSKIANPAGIAQRCTVTKADCLLSENVQVEEKCVVKESVIGPNCVIKSGARLTRCLLMDDVVVGEKCQLTDCIIGRRARIGKESVLKECRVQDGNAVVEETEAKGEDVMVFEGLDEEGDFEEGGEDGEPEGEGEDIVIG